MSNNYLILMPEITKGMKSIGSKALLKLNSKLTILEYQIKSIKSINRRNKIFLATGFQNNKIVKLIQNYKNVYIIYEKNYLKYNDTKHLINYMKHLNSFEDVFIINNGILFRNDCFKSIKKNESKIFLLDNSKDNFNIGCSNHDYVYLFYDLPKKWSECVFLKKEALQEIFQLNTNKNIGHYFLFETLNCISETVNINPINTSHRNIMKLNSLSDLPKAKRFI